jgi:hypothetical protein
MLDLWDSQYICHLHERKPIWEYGILTYFKERRAIIIQIILMKKPSRLHEAEFSFISYQSLSKSGSTCLSRKCVNNRQPPFLSSARSIQSTKTYSIFNITTTTTTSTPRPAHCSFFFKISNQKFCTHFSSTLSCYMTANLSILDLS